MMIRTGTARPRTCFQTFLQLVAAMGRTSGSGHNSVAHRQRADELPTGASCLPLPRPHLDRRGWSHLTPANVGQDAYHVLAAAADSVAIRRRLAEKRWI